jgi:putative solute:sodium symporter small subunit
MGHHASSSPSPSHQHYWRKNLRLTAWLMLVWFGVSFGVAFFARELNFRFFGWPFSFWVLAQGALVVYVVLIGVYAHQMARLDEAHSLNED